LLNPRDRCIERSHGGLVVWEALTQKKAAFRLREAAVVIAVARRIRGRLVHGKFAFSGDVPERFGALPRSVQGARRIDFR
jgi:hypothetical protein